MHMKQSIAIIPARGGSKRIPGKNVKEFCGKPMIAYSIQAALDSGVFDEIMVSTDSAEIAQTAVSYGANVPFLRSDKTADDFATTSEVLLEVIDQYEKRKVSFTYACCIYPTAPFVTGAKLKTAMQELKKNPAHTVLPVVAFSYPPQRGMTVTDGYASLKWAQYRDCRSQDLEKLYHDCGQYYAFSIEQLKQTKNIMSGKLLALVQPELEVQDIDTPQDWQLAELKYKLLLEKENRRTYYGSV